VPNGKIGDNPITDITIWGKEPFTPAINALIREIAALPRGVAAFDDDEKLSSLVFDAEEDPALQPELERRLEALRQRLS